MQIYFPLTPHVLVLQGDIQLGFPAGPYGILEVVYLFTRDPDHVIHDLGLHLQAGVLDQLNDLFGILLLQSVADTHLLAEQFPAGIGLLAEVECLRGDPLLVGPADKYIDQLAHLHVIVRLQVQLVIFLVEVDDHMGILEIEPVGDLFSGDIDGIVQQLCVHFAYDIETGHNEDVYACLDSANVVQISANVNPVGRSAPIDLPQESLVPADFCVLALNSRKTPARMRKTAISSACVGWNPRME